MFKPRMYKSNGLEAYHLINDEGGSFLYEGKVEYSDAELFKDEQGKAYYLVTTDIGGPSKYYVEVEPEGKPIPPVHREKSISDLVKTTPEEKVAAVEPAAAPVPEKAPEPAPAIAPQPAETPAPEAPKDTCFESPEKPVAEGPKTEVPKAEEKPSTEEKPSAAEEAQAAVKAMASLGEHRPHKKSPLPLIAALFIIIIVVAAAAVAIYRPDLISSLPFISQPTPTPAPTIMPTPVPTATPTVTPTPTPTALPGGKDLYDNLLMIAPAINASDPEVLGYVANNTNKTGTSYGNLSKVCDLFDAVNKKWSLTNDNGTPQNVSRSVLTMKGSMMDYSILMASLVEAQGMDSRVVVLYDENAKMYIYYPEAKIASNDMDNFDAKVYLRGRYNITDPLIHNDGIIHWLSLSQNKTPGGYVEKLNGKTVNSKKEITGV